MNTVSKLECWKKTALGTPISLYSSRPLTELMAERPILLFGGVHGDEPEGVHLAENTLTALTEWSKSEALVPWILIPCLNVDGFIAKTRVNGRGVDLNRNYPSKDWTPTVKLDDPKKDTARYNPGPSPMSEPEVAGIVELIETHKPRLLIHCHSWEPCIVATGESSGIDGMRLTPQPAEHLAQSSSYKLVPEIGYPTPGSLSRYGWFEKGIPVICIEEQENLLDFSTIWPRFSQGMHAIFKTQSSHRGAP
ncbi:MAG: DUF2817 domain-containing protein [Bdellovibrionales bacterium]|nr:DUF2817 domain-containing protein [Bdellovibrionales bacterium]